MVVSLRHWDTYNSQCTLFHPLSTIYSNESAISIRVSNTWRPSATCWLWRFLNYDDIVTRWVRRLDDHLTYLSLGFYTFLNQYSLVYLDTSSFTSWFPDAPNGSFPSGTVPRANAMGLFSHLLSTTVYAVCLGVAYVSGEAETYFAGYILTHRINLYSSSFSSLIA